MFYNSSQQLLVPLVHATYAVLRRVVTWSVHDPHGILARARDGEPFVFACRHGQLVPLLWAMEETDLNVVVSESRDGALLAAVLERRGYNLVRGSTSRAGRRAASEALRVLRAGGRLGVAVDGPRGPRGKVQDGFLRLARAAGAPVIPLWTEGGNHWVAPGSWDSFQVPLPPGRPRICVGAPIVVGPGSDGLHEAGAQVAAGLGGWRPEPPQPRVDEAVNSPAHPSYGHS